MEIGIQFESGWKTHMPLGNGDSNQMAGLLVFVLSDINLLGGSFFPFPFFNSEIMTTCILQNGAKRIVILSNLRRWVYSLTKACNFIMTPKINTAASQGRGVTQRKVFLFSFFPFSSLFVSIPFLFTPLLYLLFFLFLASSFSLPSSFSSSPSFISFFFSSPSPFISPSPQDYSKGELQ